MYNVITGPCDPWVMLLSYSWTSFTGAWKVMNNAIVKKSLHVCNKVPDVFETCSEIIKLVQSTLFHLLLKKAVVMQLFKELTVYCVSST